MRGQPLTYGSVGSEISFRLDSGEFIKAIAVTAVNGPCSILPGENGEHLALCETVPKRVSSSRSVVQRRPPTISVDRERYMIVYEALGQAATPTLIGGRYRADAASCVQSSNGTFPDYTTCAASFSLTRTFVYDFRNDLCIAKYGGRPGPFADAAECVARNSRPDIEEWQIFQTAGEFQVTIINTERFTLGQGFETITIGYTEAIVERFFLVAGVDQIRLGPINQEFETRSPQSITNGVIGAVVDVSDQVVVETQAIELSRDGGPFVQVGLAFGPTFDTFPGLFDYGRANNPPPGSTLADTLIFPSDEWASAGTDSWTRELRFIGTAPGSTPGVVDNGPPAIPDIIPGRSREIYVQDQDGNVTLVWNLNSTEISQILTASDENNQYVVIKAGGDFNTDAELYVLANITTGVIESFGPSDQIPQVPAFPPETQSLTYFIPSQTNQCSFAAAVSIGETYDAVNNISYRSQPGLSDYDGFTEDDVQFSVRKVSPSPTQCGVISERQISRTFPALPIAGLGADANLLGVALSGVET